jgi:radical SAM protein
MITSFDERPFIVIWEATQACELACVHCRASAQTSRHPLELDTAEAKELIDQIVEAAPPVFVITGGDPLKRPDLFELIDYAIAKGLRTAVTPSVTSLLDPSTIRRFKEAGVARMAVSLDGSNATVHDDFRGVPGSFHSTLRAIRHAQECGLPLQINTTYSRRNYDDLSGMIELVRELPIELWSVFFLVPTGRGEKEEMLNALQCERVFAELFALSKQVRFGIKTTEAMHYRRYVMQHESHGFPASGADLVRNGNRAPRGINDAKGFVFVSHLGSVFPSGFLPLAAGNVRTERLLTIYRESTLFQALRDSSLLEGKCGACEYRNICGGSRARAYAMTGDVFASDWSCIYVPRSMRKMSLHTPGSHALSPRGMPFHAT